MECSNPLTDQMQKDRLGLIQFLSRKLGCPHSAADVYQSLFERLLERPIASDIDNPRAYLYRAAANEAYSFQRSEKARARYEEAAAQQKPVSDPRSPEKLASDRAELRVVQQALKELPLLTQRMFIEFRLHGQTQNAIAKKYRVSLSTVEKRIAKAARHCHRRLQQSGITGVARGKRL